MLFHSKLSSTHTNTQLTDSTTGLLKWLVIIMLTELCPAPVGCQQRML